MKTILEIQKLDRQIYALNREVDKCPASVDFINYKKFLQDGKMRFEQLEQQASIVVKSYEKALSKFSQVKTDSDKLKKKNIDEMNLDNTESLLGEVNSLSGEISEENRHIEDLVRKAEEIVRKTNELSQKLTEAKKRSAIIKERIEDKRKEVEPKIKELQKKIVELESQIKDIDKYNKYKEMKEKGVFPVYVGIEDVFCGGCKVELSLNFIEKLKNNKVLPCEHCGRFIMYK